MGMSESLKSWNEGGWVRVDFARQLEIERDEAKKELNRLAGTPLSVALSERDDALNQITGWENKWMCAVRMAAKAENERDEARDAFVIATDQMVLAQCKLREANNLVEKAKELIARWDQPPWKDAIPTARFLNALRIAVRAYEEKP